jgi:hypothetical protein
MFTKHLRHLFCVITLIAPWLLFSSAYGGLFGPSNYEECVLDGAKAARTSDAIFAIRSACASKFKDATISYSREEKNEFERREKLRKKCGLDSYDDLDGRRIFVTKKYPTVAREISNIKSMQFDAGMNSIGFQNNSKVGISALLIGFGPAGKKCSYDPMDYQATLVCTRGIATTGVPSGLYGVLPCQAEVKRFRELSYCVVGVAPMTDTSHLSDVVNNAGWCD